MLSNKKRLEIANICYANVSSEFASFCNPKFRGPNFTWSNFVDMCANWAPLWMMQNYVNGNEKDINALAIKYTREIANTMLDHSGFLGDDNASN